MADSNSGDESVADPDGAESVDVQPGNSEPADADPEAEPVDAGPAESEPVGDDPKPEPVEPGSPSLEGALFVLLGVLTTLFVFARIVGLFG